jgi:hypothetical protein
MGKFNTSKITQYEQLLLMRWAKPLATNLLSIRQQSIELRKHLYSAYSKCFFPLLEDSDSPRKPILTNATLV